MHTPFNTNTYLADPTFRKAFSVKQSKHIICKDGFKVSIQASEYYYCFPRNNTGPYEFVELGFPSSAPEFGIMEYAEDADNPTDTVYAQVPVYLVDMLINHHGGIDLSHEHYTQKESK